MTGAEMTGAETTTGTETTGAETTTETKTTGADMAGADMAGADMGPGGTRELYPFLGPDRSASGTPLLDAALAEVSRSTAEKAAEIVRLRGEVAERSTGALVACAEAMADRFGAGGRLFAFGNGGSSTDAEGVAAAFSFPRGGRPLPAHCLTSDAAVITALANDVGFDVVFARQLAALGRPGDIALGLSTSGGSANVVQGLEEAGRRGMLTVAFAGYQGGRLTDRDDLDHLFVIPSTSVHRIQEAQTTAYHVLWELVQHALGALPVRGTA